MIMFREMVLQVSFHFFIGSDELKAASGCSRKGACMIFVSRLRNEPKECYHCERATAWLDFFTCKFKHGISSYFLT